MKMQNADICRIAERISFKEGTYLITGATGFIGKYVVLSLLYAMTHNIASIKVIAVVHDKSKAEELFAEYLECKGFMIRQSEMTMPYSISEPINYIIHAAANTSRKAFIKEPYSVIHDNIEGCNNILDLAKKKNVTKFLLVSTAMVYGELLSKNQIVETVLGGNKSMSHLACYAESKRASEYLLASFKEQFGLSCNAVRLFTVYGPGMNLNSGNIFSDLFMQAIMGKDIVIQGSGNGIRNWSYITDVVYGIFLVLYKGVCGEAYNVGNETEEGTIREFAETVRRMVSKDKKVIVKNKIESTLVRDSIQSPCLNKIKQIGYYSEIDLREGLHRMLQGINS